MKRHRNDETWMVATATVPWEPMDDFVESAAGRPQEDKAEDEDDVDIDDDEYAEDDDAEEDDDDTSDVE